MDKNIDSKLQFFGGYASSMDGKSAWIGICLGLTKKSFKPWIPLILKQEKYERCILVDKYVDIIIEIENKLLQQFQCFRNTCF